jgi:2-iminobutanoate/2-iminopropanoate deaminase
MKIVTEVPNAPKAIGPYSPAVVAQGFIFTSGQIPLHPETGQITSQSVRDQTGQVLDNLAAVLAAAGATFADVVKTTIFLTDLGAFGTVNEVYEAKMGGAKPARSTIQVAALPRGSQVEIEMIAVAK